jgi:hypothetical protein
VKNIRAATLLPLLAATIVGAGVTCTHCGANPSIGQVATVASLTIEDVTCIMRVYSTDRQDGKSEIAAGLDAAVTCHVAQDAVNILLASHKAAMIREQAAPSSDAGTTVFDDASSVRFFIPAR